MDAEGELRAGSEVGQYVIEGRIGGGGYGIVYAARHHALKQRVAIKVLRAEVALSPVLVTRFVREAQAVNRIKHPNIVSIYEFGERAPGQPYYVMELLEGMDLLALLGLHARFSAKEALDLLGPVCEAIAAAHAVGIIHRDIKASNVMVSSGEGPRVVKLLDFGIAKIVSTETANIGLTEPGARLGTSGNMAPEQIRGEPIDARADIYALGVLLYQLLTGEPLFHGASPQQVALLHLQTPAPRPSAIAPVSPELEAVVLRCLEKLPERRYQTAVALLDAFREAVGHSEEPRALSARAVAFYCEVQSEPEDTDLSDALLDDLLAVLELTQQTLRERGFVFPLQTSNALLAVRLVAPDTSAEQARADAQTIGSELMRQLKQRRAAHPALVPALSMTLAEAQYRSSPDGIEVIGGPLFEIDAWAVQNRL